MERKESLEEDFNLPESRKKNSSKTFIVGTLIGGVIGASSALLFAPKSGKALRQDIETKANNVAHKTSSISHEAKEKGKVFADYAKKKSMAITDQTKNVIDQVKEWNHSSIEEENDHTHDQHESDHLDDETSTAKLEEK
jgi:gas vesicle protein